MIKYVTLNEVFCGSRGSCVKSDKLPQMMSLESVSVGSEDYKNEKKSGGVEFEEVRLLDVCSPLHISA